MKNKRIFFLSVILCLQNLTAQVILNADGPGNTYELITSVLAPGHNPVEVPDCNHSDFGRHIDEVFDTELNTYVFRFFSHKTPDNDRCINFDRQRVEIKTYDQSPNNLLGVEGETVVYKWKFKLDSDFQPSQNFTHIHQLKAVGGLQSSMPLFTLTLRKGSPDKMELRYAESTNQITLYEVNLSLFKGVWVEVTETITYGESGEYAISISRIDSGIEIFSYQNNDIRNWRTGADFIRPKWGIYRSLNDSDNLRDETVLFANFSIEETGGVLAIDDYFLENKKLVVFPNPTLNELTIKGISIEDYDEVVLYSISGMKIALQKKTTKNTIDVSFLQDGLYFLLLKNKHQIVKRVKFIKNN
ncbi:MAG: T9SS type A sorting domain-containing protein [Flavobacteriaceae bacterium]|nr:T9SS type A sorting domain-containing protein [Flavobacteriaceae bacterium]